MSIHKKQSLHLLILLHFCSLFICNCGSRQIKDKDSLDINHEQAKSGDKNSYENYEKALEKAQEENNPELQEMIIKDLASIPTDESRELLKKEAQSESTSNEINTMALNGLYEQSKASDDPEVTKKIYSDIIDIIKKNADKNNGLSSNEIQILGEIKDDESEKLLIEDLLKPSENDEIRKSEIVQALVRIFVDRKNELKKQNELESPDLEKKSKLEASFKNIEDTLLNLIKSDTSKILKTTILNELYNAYTPDSRNKFMAMYNSNIYDEETKLLILKVLGYQKDPGNDEIIRSLKSEFLKTENTKEHTRILNRIGALMPEDFKVIKAELEKEMEKIIRRKELKALSAKGQIIMLKTVLKKYHISDVLIDKIQAATEELSLDKTTPMKAEAVILFSSVREIYPNKDFFEIQKAVQNGLRLPGLFLAILNSIDKDFTSHDMKILTIKSVWKIEEADAENIYKAYQNEKGLLRELLH
ncbi:MAG: hypothetical protein OEV78_01930 [Spirochaetia bacterium]|nr:hypothetical protein [Spirochaetia bacterium]